MKKLVIFVGFVPKSYLDIFLEEGYEVGFFEDCTNPLTSETFTEYVLPKLTFKYSINFSTFRSIDSSLKDLHIHKDTILVCPRDNYFLANAKIAQVLELQQSRLMPVDTARNITNKFFQRQLFIKQYPEITVPAKMIRTFHDAYLFVRKNGFPVIVKPANLSQGKLVHICNNLEELIRDVSYVLDTVAEVYRSQNVRRKPQVIMEKFIDGDQYSIDSYVDHKGNITHTPVCKQTISHDLGFDDFQTYYSGYSSGLSKEKESEVRDVASKAIKALNLKANPTHIELKVTSSGEVKIIEVNVRPGGYRVSMLKESYGINHVLNMINTYTNKPVKVSEKFQKYSTSPQFWAEQEGELLSIDGIDQVKKLPSFVSFGAVISIGQNAGPVSKGYPRTCYSILANEDENQLKKDLIEIRKLIKIKIKKGLSD